MSENRKLKIYIYIETILFYNNGSDR